MMSNEPSHAACRPSFWPLFAPPLLTAFTGVKAGAGLLHLHVLCKTIAVHVALLLLR
jgi:hypothetical protein